MASAIGVLGAVGHDSRAPEIRPPNGGLNVLPYFQATVGGRCMGPITVYTLLRTTVSPTFTILSPMSGTGTVPARDWAGALVRPVVKFQATETLLRRVKRADLTLSHANV